LAPERIQFVRNPDFIFRQIVEETILVPVYQNVADMDAIYTLNPLGAFVWEHLAEPTDLEALQAAILQEFDVNPDTALTDLEAFLSEMETINAVKRV